jgi:arginase
VTEDRSIPSLTLIGAPTSAGAYAPGQEDGPAALRKHGLADELRRLGAYVNDAGDIPRWRWRPDPSNPYAQNAAAVADGARAVAALVVEALADDTMPIVLGGDCTIELGTLSGAVSAGHDPALVYFDIHPDLNTPKSEPDGALDWMGVAHMLAEPDTVDEVTAVGPRRPLLTPERLILFGHDPEHSTPWERERIAHHGLREIEVGEIATDPEAAARRALEAATAKADRYLVHFDVDSIDFTDMPLSENTSRNYGLSFKTAMSALDVLLADERLLALTVSELNPHHGAEDGSTVRLFAERLADAIAGGSPRSPGDR